MQERLRTKQAVERPTLSIQTLRFYEHIGLLDPVRRVDNGHRRSTGADIRRVDFLKRLRTTGMPTSEMRRYVDLYRAGAYTMTERRPMFEAHRATVQAQLDGPQRDDLFLDTKISGYREQDRAG